MNEEVIQYIELMIKWAKLQNLHTGNDLMDSGDNDYWYGYAKGLTDLLAAERAGFDVSKIQVDPRFNPTF
jgi:hypothetical protein